MSLSGEFQREMKKQTVRGRCLHFEKGIRCSKIISAHSIQKSGQLANIAENGHVYRLSSNISILRKTNGRPELRKIGINKVSTFAGFCENHDNHLFKPIDAEWLMPTKEQIALYAYRSICREYFVKENAVQVLTKFNRHPDLNKEQQGFIEDHLMGQRLGFENLRHHKALYDEALQKKNFEEFQYVLFAVRAQPCLALSGLLYPDYDFLGNTLQNLIAKSGTLDLITFFTAPLINGWGFCFAWHPSSSWTCHHLMQSLQDYVKNGGKIEDALFRFSVSCCENHAFRISWWEELSKEKKNEILDRMVLMTAPSVPIFPSYLCKGCEEIVTWEIEHVLDTRPMAKDP